MIDVVCAAFRKSFSAVLWIIVIGCIIGGLIIGNSISPGLGAFIGLVAGSVAGLSIVVLWGGIVATFLHIDGTLTKIDKTLEQFATATRQGSNGKGQAVLKDVGSEGRGQAAPKEVLGSFTDPRDRQTYRTVEINGKTWMAQNLNYLPPAGKSWCYGDDNSNSDKYGRLYDWNMAKAACPAGWHLPTRQEWNDLVAAVSDSDTKLKAITGWDDNGNGTDDYGFSALPGGSRDADGSFDDAGNCGCWWTATDDGGCNAYDQEMYNNGDGVNEACVDKNSGCSVRCVRD
jgi:uncharacterized protein (TIGR02145 family)